MILMIKVHYTSFLMEILLFVILIFYNREPYMNGFSSICGDPSLMTPEESRPYAIIDEVSNVYNIGAYARLLFDNEESNNKAGQ